MKIVERILELEQQEQEIKDKIESLRASLDRKEWVFAVHTHYREPRISAWRQGNSTGTTCLLTVRKGRAKLLSAGEYQDNWKEAEAVVNKWLDEGFLGRER